MDGSRSSTLRASPALLLKTIEPELELDLADEIGGRTRVAWRAMLPLPPPPNLLVLAARRIPPHCRPLEPLQPLPSWWKRSRLGKPRIV